MGEFDRNLAGLAAAEWLFPSSPPPPTFFTAIFDHKNYTNPMSEIFSEAATSGDTQRQSPDSAETGHRHQFTSGEQRPGLGERIAARAGISSLKLNTENVRSSGCFVDSAVRSPYLTISPGLSPTILLESPVFVSNSRVQPSPTTGKFPVFCDGIGSTFCLDVPDTMEADVFDDIGFSSFGINPVSRSASPLLQDTTTKIKVSDELKNPLQGHNQEAGPAKDEILGFKSNNSSSVLDQRLIVTESGDAEFSSDLRGRFDEEHDERCNGDTMSPSEDGYSWRKYGQKLVKGCEYPRSYYKCTSIGCQVTKKVECSREGHVTAIIYKGSHNHPKSPQGDHHQSPIDMPSNVVEQSWKMNLAECNGNADATASESVGVDCDGLSESMQAQFDPIDAPLAISNEEDTDIDSGDGEAADEPKSRKRKIEASEMIGATRAVREPRVVVQTTSDVDILDDGYRWRKYGQKVVKGNPNPRSYYKCTSVGCNVRKHIERASHDVKSVITTYEGKHNHEVPAPRNAGSAGSTTRSSTEPSPVHTGLASQFTAPSPFSSFSLSQHVELFSGSSFGMSRPSLSNLYLSGLSKLPGVPMNRSSVFLLPNVEPEMEPVSRPSFNVSSGSSVYREIMNRLSLGSHM